MKLRALIAQKAQQPWYAVVMMNELYQEVPTSPFTVKLRATKEFVGQWPYDTTDAALAEIADEVVALAALAAAVPAAPAATERERDADGEVIADPRVVGKLVRVTLANGESISVVPRRDVPKESEAEETERHRVEVEQIGKVSFYAPAAKPVRWNGILWEIHEGRNEDVPAMFERIYWDSFEGDKVNGERAAQTQRMGGNNGLPQGVVVSIFDDSWISAQTPGRSQ